MRKRRLRALPRFTHAVPGAWVTFLHGAGNLLGIFLIAAHSARRCAVHFTHIALLIPFESLHEVGGVLPIF